MTHGTERVSIPHRYGKNSSVMRTLLGTVEVSIPHRYGKNEIFESGLSTAWQVSIPHRYGKNLMELTGEDYSKQSFHSS